MHIAQIEENVRQLLLNSDQQSFIYDLLLAYGKPKASVTRLQTTGPGSYNLAKGTNEVLWKKTVFFLPTAESNLDEQLKEAIESQAVARNQPRFIIVTDFNRLVAIDTSTKEPLDIPFAELAKRFSFFLPWAGFEKAQNIVDNPADVKAAEKMAKLFDILKLDNPTNDLKSTHALNVFLSRLLFCFFAEDTEIFKKDLFSLSVKAHTAEDGSDLSDYLATLFRVLNSEDRSNVPSYLEDYPYVNGGLFADEHPVPKFSRRARSILVECGADLNWSEINPDIFGSMIQAVVDVERRGNMGMHYTSFENIMKVIKPLFLDDLQEEFERSKTNSKRLHELLIRISKIKIFDPACGSGNFLIIAYKELRKLEMEAFNQLDALSKQSGLGMSGVRLSQFYGIELDDFAHEIALLSLWLAEHQMNLLSLKKFGRANPTLPLKPSGNIVSGNALTANWKTVCPNDASDEIYILGNPPYLGARQQTAEQKKVVVHNFPDVPGNGDLDLIAAWFMRAAVYIHETKAKFAFVTTNSVTQGVQVAILWPRIFELGLEIHFCHLSFKWQNNAKKNAAVICVIIGVRRKSEEAKTIYNGHLAKKAKNINAYLADAADIFVQPRKVSLSDLPPVNYGSFALDDGNYTLTQAEADSLLKQHPTAAKFLRPFVGAKELLQGGARYCLWLKDDLNEALAHAEIRKRYERVRQWRLSSDRDTTVKLAATAHLFAEIRQPKKNYLAIPTVSSERRKYLPIDFLDQRTIASNQIYVVPDATPTLFGILASRMHMVWIHSVGGKLKNDYRYSAALLYNNLAVPDLSEAKSKEIEVQVLRILAIREHYSEYTLARLYDPDEMPSDLAQAHRALDAVIEGCYGLSSNCTDEDRLTAMFKLYTKMTEAEYA